MNPIADQETILSRLTWRYAVKKFDPARKIAPEMWSALERALVLSPSSFGLQPWHFVVITDPSLRTTLRTSSWNQSQITDASHLVVFSRRTEMTPADIERHVARTAQVRGVDPASLSGFRASMMGWLEKPAPGFDVGAWASRQTYIALGFFLSTAAMLGVDACPMEGIDAAAYDRTLGLREKGYATVCVATAGYRAADDPYAAQPKVRFPLEEVISRR